MLKHELVKHIALATGILVSDVDLIFTSGLDIIKKQVRAGREVHLHQFGVFKVRLRPAKIARNLKGKVNGKRKNPEPLHLPACHVPHFKPSKKFLKAA